MYNKTKCGVLISELWNFPLKCFTENRKHEIAVYV